MLRLLLLICALPAYAGIDGAPEAVGTVDSATTPWVQVLLPYNGLEYPYLKESFTVGNVRPGSTLTVNGTTVPVYDNGSFLGMVPFSTGTFRLEYAAQWNGQIATTSVTVPVEGPEGGPATERDDLVVVEPRENLDVRSGDLIVVRCKGPAGMEGVFRIDGLTSKLPMVESDGAVKGLYEGHFWVQPQSRGENLKVRCALKKGFWGGWKAESPGRVTVLDPSQTQTAVSTAQHTIVKTIPGGYTLFYPPGVKFEVVGRRGNLSRVRLSEHEAGWVDTGRMELLPNGTPPPRATVGQWVRTYPEDNRIRLKIRATDNVPYEVRQTNDPVEFEIRFFGAVQRFDRIVYRSNDPIVREIHWRQESSRVVAVMVKTNLKWSWGYHGEYDDENSFVLDIKRPPDLTRSENVLAGRKIVIDPGHGPQEWTHTPHGVSERDLNMDLGRLLEGMLLEAGSDVYMIRTSTDGPPLVDRPALATEAGGELYVSIHHNGFRQTWNPFDAERGFTTFYYHAQSMPLVEAVHDQYRQRHPEWADEHVRWGDLHVLRNTDMPSILTENGYLILPWHEKRVTDPVYQKKIAGTMFEGIKAFYEEYRQIQEKNPSEQAAAGALD